MSNFLTSSIGKKIILSLSGLFLIAFLCVHLALNLLLIVDNSGELFNIGAHFMATNPIIKIVEPILAIGFIIHIILAHVLSSTIFADNQEIVHGHPETCTSWEVWF